MKIILQNQKQTLFTEIILQKKRCPLIYGYSFQKIKLDNANLSLISIDDDKPIREWQIDIVSGEATLIPMFDIKLDMS